MHTSGNDRRRKAGGIARCPVVPGVACQGGVGASLSLRDSGKRAEAVDLAIATRTGVDGITVCADFLVMRRLHIKARIIIERGAFVGQPRADALAALEDEVDAVRRGD